VLVDGPQLVEDCRRFFARTPEVTCIAPRAPPKAMAQFYGGKKFNYKPLALLDSSFDEVLFLDADVLPLHPVEHLFDVCEYQRTGALFMPDLYGAACEGFSWGPNTAVCGQSAWPGHAMWQLVGAPWAPKWPLAQEFESGVMLVDKRRHERALKLTSHFLESDTVAKLLFGDKDAFKFALVALGEPFALNRDRPTQVLSIPEHERSQPGDQEWHRMGELQRISGVYMFAHHLPRPASVLFSAQQAGKPIGLALPRTDLPGPLQYTYSPRVYDGYRNHVFVEQGEHELVWVPKEGTVQEPGWIAAGAAQGDIGGASPAAVQDGIDGLKYLASAGLRRSLAQLEMHEDEVGY